MYRTMETKATSGKEEKSFLRFEVLLDLTETVATLTMGAGFLLLVAVCLSAL